QDRARDPRVRYPQIKSLLRGAAAKRATHARIHLPYQAAVGARLDRPFHLLADHIVSELRHRRIIFPVVLHHFAKDFQAFRRLTDVIRDSRHARGTDFPTDIVDHQPLDALRPPARVRHRDYSAHRRANQTRTRCAQLLEHSPEVRHIILREIFRRRTPLAVAAPPHVNRYHVILSRQMRRERVKVVRVATQPMHAYDPRRALIAVIQVVEPKTVRADEFIGCHYFFSSPSLNSDAAFAQAATISRARLSIAVPRA